MESYLTQDMVISAHTVRNTKAKNPTQSVNSETPNDNSEAEIGKKARSGLLWLGSTNVVWQALSWVLTLLTARLLAAEDYGLIALVDSAFPYLALLSALSMQTWIVQEEKLGEKGLKTVFSLTVVFGAIISLAAYSVAPAVASFYETPKLETPFQILSVVFFIKGIYLVPESMLRRELRFKPIALSKFGVGLSRSIIQLTLAVFGFEYWALVIGMLYQEIALLIVFIAIRGLPKGFACEAETARKVLRFGIPATCAHVFWIVFSTADEVVIGKFLGVEVLGYYSLAFLLIDLPLAKINDIVRPVFIPYLSKLKSDKEVLRKAFLRAVNAMASVTFPALLGLAAVSGEVVPVLLGEHWLPMIQPLFLLCFVGIWRAFTDNIPPLLLATGHPEKELKIYFYSALLLPPAFVYFGSNYGLNGVLGVWLLGYPLVIAIMLQTLNEVMGITPSRYIENLKPPLLAPITMLVLLFFALDPLLKDLVGQIPLLVIKILAGAVTYCLIVKFVFPRQFNALLAFAKGR